LISFVHLTFRAPSLAPGPPSISCSSTCTDPFALLIADHNEQRSLTSQLSSFSATESHLILPIMHQLVRAEHSHTIAENAVLPPALRKVLGDTEGNRLVDKLASDDAAISKALCTLQSSAPAVDFQVFRSALVAFSGVLIAHLNFEEASIFPLLASISAQEKAAMSAALIDAKARAPAPTLMTALKESATGFLTSISNLVGAAGNAIGVGGK